MPLADPPRRDLSALFSPASVAVVGASDDPVKWGNWLAVRALRGEERRAVHLVNRRGGTVLHRPAHPSLHDVPGGAGASGACGWSSGCARCASRRCAPPQPTSTASSTARCAT